MTPIVSGHFDTVAQAEAAVSELHRAGLNAEEINLFFNGPPGQHGAFPLGGDEHADPEARGAEHSTMLGTAIGAGIGVVAGAIAGPIGAAAGAAVGGYAGSLAGTMAGLGREGEDERRRPAGVIVAVDARREGMEARSMELLRQAHAERVEVTEGEWRQGEWADFDPVAPPQSRQPAVNRSGAASGRADRPEVVYRVSPGGAGRWNVFEGDLGKLLSEFPQRDEALEYAASLARMKPLAVVETYRAGGVLDSSRVYSSDDRYAGAR